MASAIGVEVGDCQFKLQNHIYVSGFGEKGPYHRKNLIKVTAQNT